MTDARSGAIALKPSELSQDVSWRAFWDCALAGAVGILNGFAVFVLTWEEETSIPKFLVILLLVALFAYAFEYIRDVIEGHEHHVSASKSVAGLFLIAIFELFIMALHAAFKASKGWLEIGTAALGPILAKQSGPVANVITMALLWVVIGSALAAGLSLAIDDPRQNQQPAKLPRTSNKRFGAIIGLLAGTVGAPVVVFLYILVVRFIAEVRWMLSK